MLAYLSPFCKCFSYDGDFGRKREKETIPFSPCNNSRNFRSVKHQNGSRFLPLTQADQDMRCWSDFGCHLPLLSRLCICSLYLFGAGALFMRWRVLLQKRQAATMLRFPFPPPSQRATRCSAVHLNFAASDIEIECLKAKPSLSFSHIRLPQ